MPMIDTPLMRGMERVLDFSTFRQQLLAANLANVDTPGLAAIYRAQMRAVAAGAR
jgi:flagellar basal body rod protein FlgB